MYQLPIKLGNFINDICRDDRSCITVIEKNRYNELLEQHELPFIALTRAKLLDLPLCDLKEGREYFDVIKDITITEIKTNITLGLTLYTLWADCNFDDAYKKISSIYGDDPFGGMMDTIYKGSLYVD